MSTGTAPASAHADTAAIWAQLRAEAETVAARESVLADLLQVCVLDRKGLGEAIGYRLARKLGQHAVPLDYIQGVFCEVLAAEPKVTGAVACDLAAIRERDPATEDYLSPFLYQKGFHAISSYRIAHHLYHNGRRDMALYFQSLISEVFQVDIHPAARIGCGLLLDHATSVVVGETAVIEDDVSLLHEVTLGGTGKVHGDRHPKVRRGVLIGAGAKILGNVEIGEGAKIGAGSVVLEDVPAHTTAVGVPARVVGKVDGDSPARSMDHKISCWTEASGK